MVRMSAGRFVYSSLFLLVVFSGTVRAAIPGEVTGLTIDQSSSLHWNSEPGADDYNVYRGLVDELSRGVPARCHGDEIAGLTFASPAVPSPGRAYLYLVTAESDADGEGTPGSDSNSVERERLGLCDAVVKSQLFDRLGYGPSPWARDRLNTLGVAAYIEEQLDPDSIDESDNSALNNRISVWDPPANHRELVYMHIDRAIYARRQLEFAATDFWQNHFTTFWQKTRNFYGGFYDAIDFERAGRLANDTHQREWESFRDLAFNGTVREILEASTFSPAMLIYLDNIVNVASAPNENYAREVMELHTMGVDNGYTQQDIIQLARVFTGWEVCKKAYADQDDPLAPCTDPWFGEEGVWVAHFNVDNHDSGEKILFPGTPYETIIPDTSANPVDGVNDVGLALDGIVAHPSTAKFLSTKMLAAFITETPSDAMIQQVVDTFDSTGGNLREMLRTVLSVENVLNPDYAVDKIKTPREFLYSAYRSLEGETDIYNILIIYAWLNDLDNMPFNRIEPDGYPEEGLPWMTTNQILDRQDRGMIIAADPLYRSGITAQVNEHGLDSAEKIIDFYADLLYGGALTPKERSAALEYLETDALGNPAPYDDARIRETVGFMLGFFQFNEQ